MTYPSAPVNHDTADLLSLIAEDQHPSVDYEWRRFVQGLRATADQAGVIDPNWLRENLRGDIAPRRIGAFTNRALAERLIEPTGEWRVSDDRVGRNGGKPCRVYRWAGGEL